MRAGDRAANVLTHRVSETIRFDANCCDLPPISRVGGNDNRRFAPRDGVTPLKDWLKLKRSEELLHSI